MKEESKDLQPVVQPSVENIILEIDSIDKETKGIYTETGTITDHHVDQREMMSNMCEKFTNKKDVVRCKVIACFKDNKYCYK